LVHSSLYFALITASFGGGPDRIKRPGSGRL